MKPQVHLLDGVPFVATPYRKGIYIREDVFWKQFSIACQGNVEYPEDDPIYGTYWRPCHLTIGHTGLIADAITLIENQLSQDSFDLGDDAEALDFVPEIFTVHDRDGQLVLAGRARDHGVQWCLPAMSDMEAERVAEEIARLNAESRFEQGWDNYETAKGLHLQARTLEGRLVHRAWRTYAQQVILAAAG